MSTFCFILYIPYNFYIFNLGRRFTRIYAENYFLKVSNNLLRQLNLIFKILIICGHLRPIIKNYSFLISLVKLTFFLKKGFTILQATAINK